MPDVIKKPSPDIFELFDNPCPERDYIITHVCPEFTSLCPKTGQPDYGTLTFKFIPDKLCDLVSVMKPRCLRLTAEFTPRGGLHSIIVADYVAPGYNPPANF